VVKLNMLNILLKIIFFNFFKVKKTCFVLIVLFVRSIFLFYGTFMMDIYVKKNKGCSRPYFADPGRI
jgi:hypothetical protein